MRRHPTVFLVALTIACLGWFAHGARPGVPAVLAQAAVTVPGNAGPTGTAGERPLVDTGFLLQPGQTARLTASGTVNYGCSGCDFGPAGDPSGVCGSFTRRQDGVTYNCGLPGQTNGLIGQLDSGPLQHFGPCVTLVGSAAPVPPPDPSCPTIIGSGELLLGVNDNYYGDNSGAYQVTITAAAGGPQVWTLNDAGTQNPPSYHLFDDIQYCFSTPSFGASVLTDLTPDGASTVVYQYGGDATRQCVTGTVLFDGGQECLQLAFTPVQGGVSGATQMLQVCWTDMP